MNMFQLEKLNVLYNVLYDLFDFEEFDYHDFEIVENSNDFATLEANFSVKYNIFNDSHEKTIQYRIVFKDDRNETIEVYNNDILVHKYERTYEYNNTNIKYLDISTKVKKMY